jgi:DNA primase
MVGYHGRAIEKGIEPKYWNTSGFDIKEHIFNYDGVEPGGELIVVEGAFNAMSMWEKGFSNVVATFGTKFTSDQVKKIFALAPESIVICFDRDTNTQRSGQKAAMALGALTHQLVDTYIMPLPKGKDPNQLSEEVLRSCYQKKVKYDDIRREPV